LRIGNTKVPVYTPETKLKVPDVLFYENAQVTMHDGEVFSAVVSVIIRYYMLLFYSELGFSQMLDSL